MTQFTPRVGIVAGGLLLLAVACSSDQSEIIRTVSPDSAIAAIVIREDSGGAAGSRAYFVYLQSANRRSRSDSPVISATHCESLKPVWKSASTLQVEYSSDCSIFGFKNHWYDVSDDVDDRSTDLTVEIVLIRIEGGGPAR